MILPKAELKKTVAKRLKEFRSVYNLTQIEICEALNMYQSRYCRIESGSANLTVHAVHILHEKFGLNPAYLFGSNSQMIDLERVK